jgi:nitrite reductase/ring-hydroxylating ferredoxin subunit
MMTHMDAPKKLNRREFLSWLGRFAAWAIWAGRRSDGSVFKPRWSRRLRRRSGGWRPREFEPGTVSYVREGRFFISRLEDGGVLAYGAAHLGCTVPWREDEGQFHCPCHSSFFNRQGEVTGGPAPRPLDLFPVSQKDGNLVVDTSRPIERQAFEASQVFFPGEVS